MELRELDLEIQEMNLIRNLRKWKHDSVKKSEVCVIKALKADNINLQNDMSKYKQQLIDRGNSRETDKYDREERLQAAIEQRTKMFLSQQLKDQKIQKVQNRVETVTNNPDLEIRVQALELWQATFSVDTSKNFAKQRADTNLKSAELR